MGRVRVLGIGTNITAAANWCFLRIAGISIGADFESQAAIQIEERTFFQPKHGSNTPGGDYPFMSNGFKFLHVRIFFLQIGCVLRFVV